MKLVVIYFSALVGCLGLAAITSKAPTPKLCLCWPYGQHKVAGAIPHTERNEYVSYGSYESEADWNSPERMLSLNYNQAEGKRIFYQQCVWCHADATPAGPSNRSNVTPDPPLMNDGAVLNKESDAALRKMITLGGSSVGKSAMMPPYGKELTQEEINDVIAYMRVIAAPEYHDSASKSKSIWKGKL